MNYKSEVGKLGEDLACEYLLSKGYKIIDRNYRKPWGELDIIAKDPANILVFVEVKTMRSRPESRILDAAMPHRDNPAIHSEQCRTVAALQPEDNLTAAKLKKLQRTAQMFAGQFPHLVDDKRGWRIDLLAITLPANKINHYENI